MINQKDTAVKTHKEKPHAKKPPEKTSKSLKKYGTVIRSFRFIIKKKAPDSSLVYPQKRRNWPGIAHDEMQRCDTAG